MDEIVDVYLSWQFLTIGVVVYFIFGFFNNFLGPRLWKIKNTRWRKTLKFFEGAKMVWPPVFGFALAWIPGMPRPEPLAESETITVALLYVVAGLGCQSVVKGVKKALEARGIDIDLDLDPKEQKKQRICK